MEKLDWNSAIEAAAKLAETSKGYPTHESEAIRALKRDLNQWYPIETVPNNIKVDIYVNHIDGYNFRLPNMSKSDNIWRYTCGNVCLNKLEKVLTPTHWMPPPEPPVSK